MTVAIIDYGSGNLRSAAKAFERAAREAGLDRQVVVTADPEVVRAAERVVLPGVGAFGACRDGLYAVPGMVEALQEAAIARGRPFFGICVGMQLMASVGREHGDHPGLGWIAGEVTALAPADPALKIPHMGWNALELPQMGEIPPSQHPVLDGVASGTYVYFVHGYQFRPESSEHLLARVDYGGPVVAVVGRDNLFGTQFHPEKSQAAGLAIIGNFLRWRP
jgi:glutamine amidotransferase